MVQLDLFQSICKCSANPSEISITCSKGKSLEEILDTLSAIQTPLDELIISNTPINEVHFSNFCIICNLIGCSVKS